MDKGQGRELRTARIAGEFDNFVLDKSIFSNIFEKDIRRVYIYKKAERLAKAIHLIAPAFRSSPALLERLDRLSIALVDAAVKEPGAARSRLSHELLALSSVLAIARSSSLLSSMNTELIIREAHQLLQEVATYEEPRVHLEEMSSLAALAKDATVQPQIKSNARTQETANRAPRREAGEAEQSIGHLSDKTSGRRDAILSILKSKGPSYIKDISTVIREVSEKTIQRELQVLVEQGVVARTGERRWTTYSLAKP